MYLELMSTQATYVRNVLEVIQYSHNHNICCQEDDCEDKAFHGLVFASVLMCFSPTEATLSVAEEAKPHTGEQCCHDNTQSSHHEYRDKPGGLLGQRLPVWRYRIT